ncbi:unnamed protein product, partial [marine sediment metagenome]
RIRAGHPLVMFAADNTSTISVKATNATSSEVQLLPDVSGEILVFQDTETPAAGTHLMHGATVGEAVNSILTSDATYVYMDSLASLTQGADNRIALGTANAIQLYTGNTFMGQLFKNGSIAEFLVGFGAQQGRLNLAFLNSAAAAATASINVNNLLLARSLELPDASGTVAIWGQEVTEALTVAETALTTGALTAGTSYEVTVVASGATNSHTVASVYSDTAVTTLTTAHLETAGLVFKSAGIVTPDYTGGLELTPVFPNRGSSILVSSTSAAFSRPITTSGAVAGQRLKIIQTGATGFEVESSATDANTLTISGAVVFSLANDAAIWEFNGTNWLQDSALVGNS